MTNKNIKIKDDFLNQEDFGNIQELMLGRVEFPWFYIDNIVFQDDVDKFQFVHVFYIHATPNSAFLGKLKSILDIINPVAVIKVKANLLTRTPNIVENAFHIDMLDISKESLKQWTTSIFYVNTNNGYTKFENGTKIESVANRMITFPASMKHAGTSCTDEKTRVVINFNYFKDVYAT